MLDVLLDWVRDHETLVWWIGLLSLGMVLIGALLIPLLVVRLPADYFRKPRARRRLWLERQPVVREVVFVLRNVLGLVLVLAGIAMLVLPGQGILTILIGLTILSFPGKHALIHRLVRQSSVLRTINWMRAKAERPPLDVPEELSSGSA